MWTVPLSLLLGLRLGGNYLFLTPLLAWIVFPILEWACGRSETVPKPDPNPSFLKKILYEFLIVGYIILSGYAAFQALSSVEGNFWKTAFSLSFVLAYAQVCCHEWGHRKPLAFRFFNAFLSAFFSCGLFMWIDHVRGYHHNPKWTSTSLDSDSTSPKGTNILYFFYKNMRNSSPIRHVMQKSLSLKWKLLVPFFMLVVYFVFSWQASVCYLLSAFVGLLFASTLVYIQHYGLNRSFEEPFSTANVWDCDFIFSHLILCNFPKHMHHHEQASAPYWALSLYPNSNRLPYGYMTMALLAFIPPLFFRVMDPLVDKARQKISGRPDAGL